MPNLSSRKYTTFLIMARETRVVYIQKHGREMSSHHHDCTFHIVTYTAEQRETYTIHLTISIMTTSVAESFQKSSESLHFASRSPCGHGLASNRFGARYHGRVLWLAHVSMIAVRHGHQSNSDKHATFMCLQNVMHVLLCQSFPWHDLPIMHTREARHPPMLVDACLQY